MYAKLVLTYNSRGGGSSGTDQIIAVKAGNDWVEGTQPESNDQHLTDPNNGVTWDCMPQLEMDNQKLSNEFNSDTGESYDPDVRDGKIEIDVTDFVNDAMEDGELTIGLFEKIGAQIHLVSREGSGNNADMAPTLEISSKQVTNTLGISAVSGDPESVVITISDRVSENSVLRYSVSDGPIDIPEYGTDVPQDLAEMESGVTQIPASDDRYVAVYETNSAGNILSFGQARVSDVLTQAADDGDTYDSDKQSSAGGTALLAIIIAVVAIAVVGAGTYFMKKRSKDSK